VEEALEEHIKILHRYNEAKDATQSILGRLGNPTILIFNTNTPIAEHKAVTIKSMYEEYGLDEND